MPSTGQTSTVTAHVDSLLFTREESHQSSRNVFMGGDTLRKSSKFIFMYGLTLKDLATFWFVEERYTLQLLTNSVDCVCTVVF